MSKRHSYSLLSFFFQTIPPASNGEDHGVKCYLFLRIFISEEFNVYVRIIVLLVRVLK